MGNAFPIPYASIANTVVPRQAMELPSTKIPEERRLLRLLGFYVVFRGSGGMCA